jgi:cyclohexanecarboxyl-CoA dehydrogenase
MKTRALRDGDFYVLAGEKSPVSFGMDADFALLFAKTEPDGGAGKISAFLVPLDYSGITRSRNTNMGLLPSPSAEIKLNEVRIPVKYRIGKECEGYIINRNLGLSSDFVRILSGLIPLGLAQNALGLAISYAKKRTAFGKPIGQFQAISGKIAEAATMIEMGRWLCYRALWLKDQGLPHTKEAAMCSWWCPISAYRVIEDALLIHGHAGYSEDHPFQQMLRDVVAFEMIGGTKEMMQLVIAEKTVGKSAIPDNIPSE